MNSINNTQTHWENVFQTKDTSRVSWFQEKPELSLNLIKQYADSKSVSVIDVGGGDSRLPDFLIHDGFENISVLDISGDAIAASKERLRANETKANWIVSDILNFKQDMEFDIWHDRAVFHFLVDHKSQLKYKEKMLSNISSHGYAIIGGFSKNSDAKQCSGLRVCQHDRESIFKIFGPEFMMVDDFEQVHHTPSGSEQNFYWSILKKTNS